MLRKRLEVVCFHITMKVLELDRGGLIHVLYVHLCFSNSHFFTRPLALGRSQDINCILCPS